jgi:hypothetical protein
MSGSNTAWVLCWRNHDDVTALRQQAALVRGEFSIRAFRHGLKFPRSSILASSTFLVSRGSLSLSCGSPGSYDKRLRVFQPHQCGEHLATPTPLVTSPCWVGISEQALRKRGTMTVQLSKLVGGTGR